MALIKKLQPLNKPLRQFLNILKSQSQQMQSARDDPILELRFICFAEVCLQIQAIILDQRYHTLA